MGWPEDTCQPTNIVICFTHSRRSAWVCHKLGNAPDIRSGTGSWVLSVFSGARHPLIKPNGNTLTLLVRTSFTIANHF